MGLFQAAGSSPPQASVMGTQEDSVPMAPQQKPQWPRRKAACSRSSALNTLGAWVPVRVTARGCRLILEQIDPRVPLYAQHTRKDSPWSAAPQQQPRALQPRWVPQSRLGVAPAQGQVSETSLPPKSATSNVKWKGPEAGKREKRKGGERG